MQILMHDIMFEKMAKQNEHTRKLILMLINIYRNQSKRSIIRINSIQGKNHY